MLERPVEEVSCWMVPESNFYEVSFTAGDERREYVNVGEPKVGVYGDEIVIKLTRMNRVEKP